MTLAIPFFLELSEQKAVFCLRDRPRLQRRARWAVPFMVAHIVASGVACGGVAVAVFAATTDCAAVARGTEEVAECLKASYRLYGDDFCGCDAVQFTPLESTVCAGFGNQGEQARALTKKWPTVKFVQVRSTSDSEGCRLTEFDMDTLAQWKSLQYLSIVALQTSIPPSWEDLSELRSLELKQTGLQELPANVVRSWRKLETLSVMMSPGLTVVPAVLWQLPSLKTVRMFGALACASVPPKWKRQACGEDRPVCEMFPQWVAEELTWRRTPRQSVCGSPGCQEVFRAFHMYDGNGDNQWSHGDLLSWLNIQLLTSKWLEAGTATGLEIGTDALRCFMLLATNGTSAEYLSAGHVARALGYSTCEECSDFPAAGSAVDPRSKPECANANVDFPVIPLARAICSPPTTCISVCSTLAAAIDLADSDRNGFFSDAELVALVAMSGAKVAFSGMNACLLAWAGCRPNSTSLRSSDAFVMGTVFFDYDTSDCSSC
mmetsp:Transcript_36120/g.94584  ORF Transcript_36120/g.94584 Transcript_36120/m.94584 type:complete len:490 (-) Transcript_36120:112-1581(-)